MGDSAAPSTGESTAEIMRALTENLPAYMQVQNAQVGPQSQAQLDVAKNISPQYQQLMADLYKQFAPQLAQTGTQVDNISRTGAAKTDLDILKGSGGELVTQAQALDKQLNPEYYKTRELQGQKLGELLGSINLNNANPEAERLINQENQRSGNAGTPSATNTVSNALSFGDQLEKRRASLGNALNTATSFLQPSQGQFNPVQTALNRPSTNTGVSQFGGVTNPSNQAYQSGGQLLQSNTAVRTQENDINANRRDLLDRLNETTTGIGSILSV